MFRIKDFIFCKLKGSKGIGIFELVITFQILKISL
jgi:hypothetical protein